MEKLQKLVLCVDLAGCPNRCRHCWIGHSPNPNLTPDDLRTLAAAFRPYTEKLEVYDWYREPDYRDNYRELWQLCNELSDEPRDHFELMSVWRAVRDPEYVPWLASLGLRQMQLTLFGDRETTDRYTGRKGAYDDILAVIEQLIAHKISPRIQYFAYRDNIDQLSHLESLIDQLQLEERCKDFAEPFDCFVHGGSVAGEAEKLYPNLVTAEDLAKIPPRIAAYTLKHMEDDSLADVFGEAESEWFVRLQNDQSTKAMADDEPVLYVDGNWNVYPNFSTPEPIWLLGNLKTDSAEAILEAYLQNKSLGQQIRLTVPLGEIISAVGDPTSKRLFGKGDYVEYCLNLYARKVLEGML